MTLGTVFVELDTTNDNNFFDEWDEALPSCDNENVVTRGLPLDSSSRAGSQITHMLHPAIFYSSIADQPEGAWAWAWAWLLLAIIDPTQ